MRRPLAVKLLDPRQANEHSIARWSRAEADAWWQKRATVQTDKTMVMPLTKL